MWRALAFALGTALIVTGSPPDKGGIRPRSAPGEYPVHEQKGGATFAAASLSKEQLRNTFVTNLADGYIVVEVAVYPAKGATLDLNRDDFLLRIGGTGDAIRPATPKTVAGVLQRKHTPRQPSDSDVNVYSTAGVGYESGATPDGRRVHGWETQTGAGVGVGKAGAPYPRQGPDSTDRDRHVMFSELSDQALPEGSVNAPVAGYLYFPLPSKKKRSGVYELRYENNGGSVRLFVPPPRS